MDILVVSTTSGSCVGSPAFEHGALRTETVDADSCNGRRNSSTSSAGMDSVRHQQQQLHGHVLWMSSPAQRVRIALDLVVRLFWPFIRSAAERLRGLRRSVRGLAVLGRNVQHSRRLLTGLFAMAANALSLNLATSSVQTVQHRIAPLLRLMRLRRHASTSAIETAAAGSPPVSRSHSLPDNLLLMPDMAAQLPSMAVRRSLQPPAESPERCVTLNVLAEPPPGTPIRADVVFVHGLHGSLVNTWKQGAWSSDGRRVHFERPPRPPVRPPKRPRHSRGAVFPAPQRTKRPRFGTGALQSASCPGTPSERFTAGESLEDCFASALSGLAAAVYDGCDEEDRHWHDDDAETDAECAEQLPPAFRLRDDRHMAAETDEAADGQAPSADVAADGFGANRVGATGDQTPAYSRCWPGDWLPLDCPGVRVIAVNYTTDPYLWRPMWIRKRNRTSLGERSREMTELLTELGVGVGRPIVWVGHSKGGIFIKQIMVDAWESGKASVAHLWRSSRGCLFYSVPHRGSPLADFNLPLVRQSVELVEIKKNSPGVLELHRRFVALYRSGHLRIQIFSFVETALTLMSVLYLRIVGIDSADPGIGEVCGVHLDHREICKPRDRNCILYTKLKKMINQVS